QMRGMPPMVSGRVLLEKPVATPTPKNIKPRKKPNMLRILIRNGKSCMTAIGLTLKKPAQPKELTIVNMPRRGMLHAVSDGQPIQHRRAAMQSVGELI